MPAECPERRRLARKVAEAVAAVYALRDQKREAGDKKRDTALSVLLDQAKIAQRDAERALHDHIQEHGCLLPKEPTQK